MKCVTIPMVCLTQTDKFMILQRHAWIKVLFKVQVRLMDFNETV